MRLAPILVAAAMACSMLGCATIAPPRPPSLDLPMPPSDLRATRKGDRVVLSWTFPSATTDRETIRVLGPTQICRGPGEMKACGAAVGQVSTPIPPSETTKQKPQGSFTDTLPSEFLSDAPDASISYSVQVLNREGRGAGLSNQVHVPLIRTMPSPQDFGARVAKEGIVLSWSGNSISPARSDVKYLYRIYRRSEGNNGAAMIGETPESDISFTDSTVEWQKTYYYHVQPVTAIRGADNSELAVEGGDSPEVKVFADDVFPPAVPSELQAVFSGPGQQAFIDLVWAPVSDSDLAGYNVYRREEGGASAGVKLNSALVLTPAYRDTGVGPHKHYFYSVTAVDTRGNESAHSDEGTEIVP